MPFDASWGDAQAGTDANVPLTDGPSLDLPPADLVLDSAQLDWMAAVDMNPHDLAAAADMADAHDLSTADFSSPRDLSVTADLAPVVDLMPSADLMPNADLFTPPSVGDSVARGVNPQRNGSQPGASIPSPLRLRWKAGVGAYGVPLIVQGTVFVSSPFAILALDGASGATRWKASSPESCQLAADSLRVYAYCQRPDFGLLMALAPDDGHLLWSTDVKLLYAPLEYEYIFYSYPVAEGGVVYVSAVGVNGMIGAYSGADGRLLWSFLDEFDGDPSIDDGLLYVRPDTQCPSVIAINATTGKSPWRSVPCNSLYDDGSTIVASLGRLFVAGNPYDSSVDAKTGTPLAMWPQAFNLSVDDDRAFFVALDGTVSAYDTLSMTRLWTLTGSIIGKPVVAHAGQQVFAASSGGTLYEIDEETGAVRSTASLMTGTSFAGGMALSNDTLVVAPGNGDVFAF